MPVLHRGRRQPFAADADGGGIRSAWRTKYVVSVRVWLKKAMRSAPRRGRYEPEVIPPDGSERLQTMRKRILQRKRQGSATRRKTRSLGAPAWERGLPARIMIRKSAEEKPARRWSRRHSYPVRLSFNARVDSFQEALHFMDRSHRNQLDAVTIGDRLDLLVRNILLIKRHWQRSGHSRSNEPRTVGGKTGPAEGRAGHGSPSESLLGAWGKS